MIEDFKKIYDNKFVIITANNYPYGDAGAIRLHSFADILNSLGYSPIVIGMGKTTHFKEENINNVSFFSLRYSSSCYIARVMGRILFTKNLKRILGSIPASSIKGILIDSGNKDTFKFIIKYARKNAIPIIYDSVEWYSPSEFKNGENNFSYKHNNDLNTRIIDANYKVIAISKYLEKNFKSKGLNTIRIPVIMDVFNIPIKRNKRNNFSIVKIVYAGSIGGKDHIKELIEAIGLLTEYEQDKIAFYVLGITKDQYEKKFGRIQNESVNKCIIFYGRVNRERVLDVLSNADFSFLLRPSEERYAMAGFPTKVVEGLSSGVPMLCNYSSDLKLYLKDGENCVIIDDCSTNACLLALKKILSYSFDELDIMKKNARRTAEENFDWRLYTEEFDNLISK